MMRLYNFGALNWSSKVIAVLSGALLVLSTLTVQSNPAVAVEAGAVRPVDLRSRQGYLTSMARGRHALATGDLLTKSLAIDAGHAPPWLRADLVLRARTCFQPRGQLKSKTAFPWLVLAVADPR